MAAAMVAAAFDSTHGFAPRPWQMVPPNRILLNQISSSAADDSNRNNKSAAVTSNISINQGMAAAYNSNKSVAAYNSNKSVATVTADSKRSNNNSMAPMISTPKNL